MIDASMIFSNHLAPIAIPMADEQSPNTSINVLTRNIAAYEL